MGCCSSKKQTTECKRCKQRGDDLVLTNEICQICIQREKPSAPPAVEVYCFDRPSVSAKPLFGEYKCKNCGRQWKSRLSWRNMYQVCQSCGAKVYPSTQRNLRQSDMKRSNDSVQEHPQHLCQKCRKLGRFCGTRYRHGKK